MSDLEMLKKLQEQIEAARKNFEPARLELEKDLLALVKKHTEKLDMLFEFEGRNTLTMKMDGYVVKLIR